jgi:hypothetical protein
MAIQDLGKKDTRIRVQNLDLSDLFVGDRSPSPSDEEQRKVETPREEGSVADSAHVEGEKATSEHRQVNVQTLDRLGREDRKNLALAAVSGLSAEDQRQVSNHLRPPTQRVTDWIWLVIIGAFAFAFILAVLTLCATVLWQTGGEIQTLLTVITTVAGLLAGFISGRASSGGSSS